MQEQRIEEILESGQALTSKARTAIFAVHDIHPEVYLLLRVEKTLQGDINSAVDTYIKGAESPKSAEKQMQLIQGAQARLSKFRMPFAWAARPVFTLDNRLDTLSPFGPLYKQVVLQAAPSPHQPLSPSHPPPLSPPPHHPSPT